MKKILSTVAIITSAFAATPAMAEEFTGFRVEATLGVDDATRIPERSDINYGAAVGIDAPLLGDKFIVGIEANVDNVFNYRDFGMSGRIGYKVNDSVLIYGKAGYADFRGLDGVRVGGGVEANVVGRVYTKVEYRYSDLQLDTGRHQALVGVGIRF